MDPQITGYREENFNKGDAKTKSTKKKKIISAYSGFTNEQTREETDDRSKITSSVKVEKREEYHLCWQKNKGDAKSLSMAEKLKEIGKMDRSNVDHVVDIEEVLHYYSHLQSPVFLGIVEHLINDVYAEFLAIEHQNSHL